jgi:ProP effector
MSTLAEQLGAIKQDIKERPNRAKREEALHFALLNVFGSKWPKAFPRDPADIKPLTLGVHQQLIDELPKVKPHQIRAALRIWCSRPKYLYTLAQRGTHRINLDGSQAEPVEDEHRNIAIERLKRRKRKKLEAERKRPRKDAKKTAATVRGGRQRLSIKSKR